MHATETYAIPPPPPPPPPTPHPSLFKAKTAFLTALSPFDMVRADQKAFSYSGKRVGFAVLEVRNTNE